MINKSWVMVKKSLHKAFSVLKGFFCDSRSIGILLIACTIVSILLSNLPSLKASYLSLWEFKTTSVSFLNLPGTNRMWINDLLMTAFFFLVGMEIKRELVHGELASVKRSLLPILAAVGGMIVPAIIFTIFNSQTPFHHGWGIPMATDIAFSLGVLSLLGKQVPIQLKIFLAALAIIDDLGAVLMIAIFYSAQIKIYFLLGGAAAVGVVLLFNRLKVSNVGLYLIPAAILWYCLFNSGIHATIAGVVMAFTMPLFQLSKLEKKLFHPVNFMIMPLFALANTAIELPSAIAPVYTSTISLGVMLGLVLGKPLGIFLFSFIASKSGVASLPSNTNLKELWGIGMMGGIGFTMSIFTSTLSYEVLHLQMIAKVSIITASLIAGVVGYAYLSRIYKIRRNEVQLKAVHGQNESEYEEIAAIA
jgi:NhaA family Na+:H+ antiporter